METTIQVKKDLKDKLNSLRLYPNESYDSVIRRLSELAEDEEPLSKETIQRIEMSLKDIKEGRVYTTDEVKKRLKIAWLRSQVDWVVSQYPGKIGQSRLWKNSGENRYCQ